MGSLTDNPTETCLLDCLWSTWLKFVCPRTSHYASNYHYPSQSIAFSGEWERWTGCWQPVNCIIIRHHVALLSEITGIRYTVPVGNASGNVYPGPWGKSSYTTFENQNIESLNLVHCFAWYKSLYKLAQKFLLHCRIPWGESSYTTFENQNIEPLDFVQLAWHKLAQKFLLPKLQKWTFLLEFDWRFLLLFVCW